MAQAIERQAAAHYSDAQLLRTVKELTSNEQAALAAALGDESKPSSANPNDIFWGRHGARARSFLFPVRGILQSVLDATSCKKSDEEPAGIANVTYRADGRVERIQTNWSGRNAACAPVVEALASLVLAEPREPVVQGASQWLLLPLDPSILACMDQSEPADDPPVPYGSRKWAGPPRQTRDVSPVYPEAIKRSRIQGVVVLEANVSKTGCVTSARVLRSLVPSLDIAALSAVLGWQFEPSVIDGRPVPVTFGIDLNFKLR
jgi:TonB family protein